MASALLRTRPTETTVGVLTLVEGRAVEMLRALGFVATRTEQLWRRARLGPALLAAVARTLADRGVTEVVTETDVANRDSYLLAADHRAVPLGRTVEWALPADRAW